ncbi:MAG: hypothetical protein KQ78_02226 [Candidatus Izimaplasma bacterium HR2]|nr:MAG: hypothetical protein KQ78_02226 [Candidatus Izimaplasma bacterium HR2]
MKKEFIIHRPLLLGYIGVIVLGGLYLIFLLVFKSNTTFDNMQATTHNVSAFIVVVGLALLVMFTPSVMISNDNKYIYFNVPKTRSEILINRYKINFLFFCLGLVVLSLFLFLVYVVFNYVGLAEHETFEIFIDVFYNKPLLSIFFLFVNFKIIFSLYYFIELINHRFKTTIFFMVGLLFTFVQLSMFTLMLMDSFIENTPLLTLFFVNIGFVLVSIVLDRLIFVKGEI